MFTLTVKNETTVWVQEHGPEVPSEIALEEIGETIHELSQQLSRGETCVLAVEIARSE